MHTLFILNPHAGGGRAGRDFQRLEHDLVDVFDDFVVAVTNTPQDLEQHLNTAAAAGLKHIIAAGGDGTNHAVLNALARRPDLDLVFGSLPLGTGRDWTRSLGMPEKPEQAVAWLAQAQPFACDLGQVTYTNPQTGERLSRIFLNSSSIGASGDVVRRVNQARFRTPLTYIQTAVASLLQHKARHVRILCDGEIFYDGDSHLVVVANGQYFGRGMWPAPDARIDDALFDVAVLEGVSRPQLLLTLQAVYSAKHVHLDHVHMSKAAEIRIQAQTSKPFDIEFDGEGEPGSDLSYSIQPGAIRVLLNPETSPAILTQRR